MNACPCSGKSTDNKKKFNGHWQFQNFRWEGKQMVCDGVMQGTWSPMSGNGPSTPCAPAPVTMPVNWGPCEPEQTCPAPPGSCNSWLSPPSGSNSGLLCGLPGALGCSPAQLAGHGRWPQGGECPVLNLQVGSVKTKLAGTEVAIEPTNVTIGAQENDTLGALLCLIGNLLGTNNWSGTWALDLCNIWLKLVNNPSQCGLIGTVERVASGALSILGLL